MAATTTRLTKSLFQRGCECPRKVAYAAQNYIEAERSDFVRALARDGHKIGRYAQWLYTENSIDLTREKESVAKTKQILEQSDETITLFEAAFEWGNCFARADILRKVGGNKLRLIEVKAKAFEPGKTAMVGKRGAIKSEFLSILRDVAFQTYVCRRAFPDFVVETCLLLPNKAAVNDIPQLYGLLESGSDEAKNMVINSTSEPLLIEREVTELVDWILKAELAVPRQTDQGENTFVDVVEEWSDVLSNMPTDIQSHFPKSMGVHCRDCEFSEGFSECWRTSSKENSQQLVLDIYRGGAKVDALIQKGIYTLAAVQPDDFFNTDKKSKSPTKKMGLQLADKQRLQINHAQLVVDRPYAMSRMMEWEYPLHFIDFETAAPPLPYHIGCKPYQNLAFQFSHHVLHEDGTVEHANEFLVNDPMQKEESPNGAFLRSLTLALEEQSGTIFRWGAHENTILASIVGLEDDWGGDTTFLKSLLKGGSREMVDLMAFVGSAYYVDGSGASTSLKKLLLPTIRHSKRLRHLYGSPNYNSSNFTSMQWWQTENPQSGDDNDPLDPYSLLPTGGVADGTAAMESYHRLHDPSLAVHELDAIRSSLLKYCELDTLAMVMIYQALEGFIDEEETPALN